LHERNEALHTKYRLAKSDLVAWAATDDYSPYTSAKTWLEVEMDIPLTHTSVMAIIVDDLGHDVDHVNMADHPAYNHVFWENVECAFMDTQTETLYFWESLHEPAAGERVGPQPGGSKMLHIDSYARTLFGSRITPIIRPDSDDHDEWTLDSHCGYECKKTLATAYALYVGLDPACDRQAVIDAAVDHCRVICYG